jgi:FdrA protein
MIERVLVRAGAYHDSVTLMLVSRAAGERAEAEDVAVGMATPLNLDLLRDRGYDLSGAGELGPNDLVIAVRARDEAAIDAALAAVEDELAAARASAVSSGLADRPPPRSLLAAARGRPDANLAFLSVPGRDVPYEAALALEAGLHVFCFSDGVAVEDEIALKRRALELGLLFMGPDCGTGIIDGTALGFANAVRRGPVGILGASGTGTQEVCCLLDAAGVGVAHAIGLGGRDLSAAVGGLMAHRALELLAADRATEVILAVSKPPDPAVAEALARAAGRAGKPVVLAFLGMNEPAAAPDGVSYAGTLEDAAGRAARLAGGALPDFAQPLERAPASGSVVGLYSGGTLCDEAMAIVAPRAGRIASNIPLRPEWALADVHRSEGHTFVDFGDDALTQGRPHPMIDQSLRLERLAREAADPAVAVLVLDVVLGHGAHPDPATELAPAIEQALARRADLHVLVALCGTAGDPQGLAAQQAALKAAGAVVLRSNAATARLALTAAGLEGAAR